MTVKKVPDVYRYDLVKISGEWELVYPNTNTPAQSGCYDHDINIIDPNKKNILVILESPHKKEYCKTSFKPIAPAIGTTGRLFSEKFTGIILSKLFSLNLQLTEEKYSICFVNPVPFQTSLQFIHKKSE